MHSVWKIYIEIVVVRTNEASALNQSLSVHFLKWLKYTTTSYECQFLQVYWNYDVCVNNPCRKLQFSTGTEFRIYFCYILNVTLYVWKRRDQKSTPRGNVVLNCYCMMKRALCRFYKISQGKYAEMWLYVGNYWQHKSICKYFIRRVKSI